MGKLREEDVIQIQVVNWLRQCTTLKFAHYANERRTTPQHGAFLKKMGVLAGVADLHLYRGNEKYRDMWIELKTPTGKVSKAQAEFLRDRMEEGSCCELCYSSEEAIEVIKRFYGI